MINFNFKKSKIFQSVKWGAYPFFKFASFFKNIFFALFIFLLFLFFYGLLSENFSQVTNSRLLGFSLICLLLSISFLLKSLFFEFKVKKPKIPFSLKEAALRPEEYNLAEILDFDVARVFWRSIIFVNKRKISEIDSSIFFYFLLSLNPKLDFIFSRALLDVKKIKKVLLSYLKNKQNKIIEKRISFSYSQDFKETILCSLRVAQEKRHRRIELGDVLVALAKNDLIFRKILIDNDLKPEDIANLVWLFEKLEREIKERRRFWDWKNLVKMGSLAKEWAAGYTIVLDKYSVDLSKEARRQGFPEIVDREREMEIIERILSRTRLNNVLLVGEPGIGRRSIIRGLATRSAIGLGLPEVNYKRFVDLNMSLLLAETKNQDELESALEKIFQESIRSGNVILVINDFHNFVKGDSQPGIIDISAILAHYLSLSQFQIIAVTTYQGLHKYIEKKPSILSLFEKVEVSEISRKETLMIIQKISLFKEQKYKIFISYPALIRIVDFCDKYFPNIRFPKKAINLLDEAVVYLVSLKEKVLLPKHIERIVSEKTEIPVGEMETRERKILLNLEDLIHKRIVNQEEAVKEISAALRRARTEVQIKKGPIGTFLFLGPTGVGKTETSKALTEIYFGAEKRMIRIDMSEFQSTKDISRLIGSTEEEGLLTTQVRENPFSLILLDEIEKAHPNILNLFLQVLDEGHLTDGLGRKVDFKNSIIIATSNAGYKIILEALREKKEWKGVKQRLLDYLFKNSIFRPEFVNRFDAVVVFKPLTKENLLSIAELMLQRLKKNLKEKGIEFVITEGLKKKIVQLGYNPTFGAREMRRIIQDKVENVLATALLSGELKKGNRVEVMSDFKLKIE